MLLIYILLIVLSAFPLVLTAWRMRKAAKIKKEGTHTNGTIQHINNVRLPRGGSVDIIRIEYKDRSTGKPYNAKATVAPGKYKIGDPFEVIYLPDQPAKYAIDTKGGYVLILIFSIILFLFILFAVYKLRGMSETGQM